MEKGHNNLHVTKAWKMTQVKGSGRTAPFPTIKNIFICLSSTHTIFCSKVIYFHKCCPVKLSEHFHIQISARIKFI